MMWCDFFPDKAYPLSKMIKKRFLSKSTLGVFSIVLSALCAGQNSTAYSLTGPIRHSDGTIQVTVNGSGGEQVTLQGSGNMTTWSDIKTYALNGTPAVYQQSVSGVQHSFFRLKTVANIPSGTTLPALSDSPNSVFVAGEGFDTVQFAPNGNLGMIFWKGRDLIAWEERLRAEVM